MSNSSEGAPRPAGGTPPHVRMAKMYLDNAIETIEAVDQRAMVSDSPVPPTRLEMTDEEMRDIYESLLQAKLQLQRLLRDAASRPAEGTTDDT